MAIQQSKTARIQMIRHLFPLLSVLLLSTACHDKIETRPQPQQVARTVFMYFPWSGNLTANFEVNIRDMESVVARGVLNNERILVYFMDTPTTAELFELCYRKGGKCVREKKKTYDAANATLPEFTTAEGLASILEDVRTYAPAGNYAMTIGCHGSAWLPVSRARGRVAGAEKEYWEYGDAEHPLTRWFGGTTAPYQTDITTLAEAIERVGMRMNYILFDDCYMASVEVAYALRNVTDHLIGSTSEVMAIGFPYKEMGEYLVGAVNYASIARAFYDFYMTYEYPYGTISVTICSELEALATVMRRINKRCTFDATQTNLNKLQFLDGYTPVRFFDMGDYVRQLCVFEPDLLAEFEEQLERTVPAIYRRHTPCFYSQIGHNKYPIRTFSGITTSDPSISPDLKDEKTRTEWWAATHETQNPPPTAR